MTFIKQEMEKHKNSGNGGKSDTKTSSAQSPFESSHLLTSSPLKVQGVTTKSEMELLVDSGTMQHMTPSNEGFIILHEIDRKIKMANKMTIESNGIGDIPARLPASDNKTDVIF